MKWWRWLLIPVALSLGGCGAPLLFGPTSGSALVSNHLATMVAGGEAAFSPAYAVNLPLVITGEQDRPPSSTAAADPGRGVAGRTTVGSTFVVTIPAGSGAQIVAAGPPRVDLVLTFVLGDEVQRVDSDPLAPDLSAEVVTITAERDLRLVIRARSADDLPSAGLVRWYAWPLPASLGRLRSEGDLTGPAGRSTVPGAFGFDVNQRGARYEVLALGPPGSDLVLRLSVGSRTYEIDADPLGRRQAAEAFVLRVDDPARVVVRVESFDGGALDGDVRWAMIPLPPEELRTAGAP